MQEIIYIVIAILLIIGIVKKLFKLVKLAIIIGIVVFAIKLILPYLAG